MRLYVSKLKNIYSETFNEMESSIVMYLQNIFDSSYHL
jgi:hypothetical protein